MDLAGGFAARKVGLEKYDIALGQSPEAIALMEINPLQYRFKNFEN